MTVFNALPRERNRQISPVAIQLVDTFTHGATLGNSQLILEAEVQPGQWEVSDAQALQGGQGVYTFPGLGRSANADHAPVKHRVIVESQFYGRYVPVETEVFLVYFFNDAQPLTPDKYARGIRKVLLLPNASYPYESHIPMVRGRITKPGLPNEPIEAAVIEHQWVKVVSNKAGEYALPVRFPPQNSQTITPTRLNEIQVRNARGYFKAKVSVEGIASVYRVDEIIWHSPTTDEARVSLLPEPGDDLPAGLPAGLKVTVKTMALHIELPGEPGLIKDIDPHTFLPNSSR